MCGFAKERWVFAGKRRLNEKKITYFKFLHYRQIWFFSVMKNKTIRFFCFNFINHPLVFLII